MFVSDPVNQEGIWTNLLRLIRTEGMQFRYLLSVQGTQVNAKTAQIGDFRLQNFCTV